MARGLLDSRQLESTVFLLTWETLGSCEDAVLQHFSLIFFTKGCVSSQATLEHKVWERALVGLCCNGKGNISIRVKGKRRDE